MHLDINVLQGFIGDDVQTQQDILLMFGTLLNETRSAVTKAIADRELDTVRSACHALKSTSRSVGAIELGRLSEQLEALGSGNASGPIDSVLSSFLAECRAVEKELAVRNGEVG